MFEVTVNTRRAVVGTKELITTSSAGIQCQFTFSGDWDELSKIAIFRNGDEGQEIPVALPNSNLVEIPAQSCYEEYVDEPIFVGVYGTDGLGAVIIPTVWVSLGVLRPGAVTTGIITPAEPTPDMWAQILAIANNAVAIADECETQEEQREAAETVRDTAEGQRASNETSRQSAEETRAAAEENRGNAEQTRIIAEQGRASAENARVEAENSRDSAESARGTAEQNRIDAESGRVSAETSRASAEQERQNQEANRASNETARITAEENRASAEASRVTAEASRVSAEAARATEFATWERTLSNKQDAPSTAGTAGQVLSLDDQLHPVWADQTGGGGGMNIVNVSGTQITQVGAGNTFYVCGELTELTFTAPSVGITMIRFTSGTTPTVLTVNGVTSWMFNNDPTTTSLEANKTYDINVLNGVGVVGWA